MVQWVHEAAMKSGVGEHVVVATPDAEIVEACRSFGAEAVLTRYDHETGTDRIAEVAEKHPADVYVNVQGDEPLIQPASIKACAEPLLNDSDIPMGSVYCECPEDEYDNPAVVKVVTDGQGFALYFSRYAIPFPRNPRVIPVKKHIGLYAYRRDALQGFCGLADVGARKGGEPGAASVHGPWRPDFHGSRCGYGTGGGHA